MPQHRRLHDKDKELVYLIRQDATGLYWNAKKFSNGSTSRVKIYDRLGDARSACTYHKFDLDDHTIEVYSLDSQQPDE